MADNVVVGRAVGSLLQEAAKVQEVVGNVNHLLQPGVTGEEVPPLRLDSGQLHLCYEFPVVEEDLGHQSDGSLQPGTPPRSCSS